MLKKVFTSLFIVLSKLIFVLFLLTLFFLYKVRIPVPDVDSTIKPESYKRVQVSTNHFTVGDNWLKKNEFGIWEMYIAGSPYERGVIYGVLAKELIELQEVSFVNQLDEMIPSVFFQKFLIGFIAWFNRDMDTYIPDENLKEIYGISQSFSDKYNFIGPKFYRILYYHAAHDIGHALADLRIVGCTSFAVKNQYSKNGNLLIGRNFDFYMGEDFMKDKLLLFEKPEKGYAFASYSWAGFTGVASGMNEKGVTVTINASKSDIPLTAKTPISLLARQVLQYCSTTEEAIALVKKNDLFVSESILVGSASEHKAVIIEKGPSDMGVYDSEEDLLVCSNHYQSDEFKDTEVNLENIKNTDTEFRHRKVSKLLESQKPIDYLGAASILRNREGENTGLEIGLGNPKAINQLICHHSIVFEPESSKFWVSSQPYQLGKYVGYDLKRVFQNKSEEAFIPELTIPIDPFVNSGEFKSFKTFRAIKSSLVKHHLMGVELEFDEELSKRFVASNPESYEVYLHLGNYYQSEEEYCKSKAMYKKCLTKEVASLAEELTIKQSLKEVSDKCVE